MLVKIPKIIQLLYPSITWFKKTNNKEIWLTFDDGPDPQVTPWILNLLKKKKITATFFLVGKEMEKFPDVVKSITKAGHTIGNHSYSHINGWKYNTKEYISDVKKCQKLMPKNSLFRPPYGKITRSQIKKLRTTYDIILWDIMAFDFKKDITPKKIQNNIIKNTKKGSIIVLHNNKKSFKNIKPILLETIEILQVQGFKFSATW